MPGLPESVADRRRRTEQSYIDPMSSASSLLFDFLAFGGLPVDAFLSELREAERSSGRWASRFSSAADRFGGMSALVRRDGEWVEFEVLLPGGYKLFERRGNAQFALRAQIPETIRHVLIGSNIRQLCGHPLLDRDAYIIEDLDDTLSGLLVASFPTETSILA